MSGLSSNNNELYYKTVVPMTMRKYVNDTYVGLVDGNMLTPEMKSHILNHINFHMDSLYAPDHAYHVSGKMAGKKFMVTIKLKKSGNPDLEYINKNYLWDKNCDNALMIGDTMLCVNLA